MQYQYSEKQTAEGCRILSLGLNGKDLEALSVLLKPRRCHLSHTKDAGIGLEMLHQAALAGNPFQVVLLDAVGLILELAILTSKIKSDPLLKELQVAVLRPASEGEGGLSSPIDPLQMTEFFDRVLPGKIRRVTGALETKMRVLVVEDHPMNQKVIEIMLTKLGYQVDIASDGLMGLEFLANVPYNLVLMDIKLPEMDGFSVVQALRNHQAGPLNQQVPVIGVTALASVQDRARCLESGMNDYLAKPFHRADLSAVLKKWCPIETPSAS